MLNPKQEKLTQLLQKHSKLSITPNLKFKVNGSGCRHAYLQDCCIYWYSQQTKKLPLQQLKYKSVLMITASHNPSTDNGIKIGRIGCHVKKDTYKMLEKQLNQTEEFVNFIQQSLQSDPVQSQRARIYIGMDCRQSSPHFKSIIINVLQILGIKYIDLHRCSTPQLWSLSQYVDEKISKGSDVEIQHLDTLSMRTEYVEQVMNAFSWMKSQIQQKQVVKKREKIVFDFANGSGAVSYESYHAKLSNFYDITKINYENFKQPNHQCGAPYFQNQWFRLGTQFYESFDLCLLFDGDSDRILIKVQNQSLCFDGNFMAILFFRGLQKILKQMNSEIYEQLCGNAQMKVKPLIVINQWINNGLKQQLSPDQLQISKVGMYNVVQKSFCTDLCVFFQPNGHGGIYFSPKFIDSIQKTLLHSPESTQLRILLSIHQISRNNSRGYALHNFLLFSFFSEYLFGQSYKQEIFHLYRHLQNVQSSLYLESEKNNLFYNDEKTRSFEGPETVMQQIQRVRDENEGYFIILRKSQTERNLIRVIIQGPDSDICNEIMERTREIFEEYRLK